MMFVKIAARSMVVLLMAASAPAALHGEPLTVTGGTVQVAVGINAARILFSGDDFLVRTSTEGFIAPMNMGPFPQGTLLTLGAEWLGDTRGGTVTGGGVPDTELYFVGNRGTFVTQPVTLAGDGLIVLTSPFTFSGTVTAYAVPEPNPWDVPVFTATLTGSGLARAAFFGVAREGFVGHFTLPGTDYNLEYVFASTAAPIPEPGTLLLVGGGAVALAARRLRRRGGNAGQPASRS